MLKSWKSRALAVGAAAAVMAPLTLVGPGVAQVTPPGPPTVVSLTPQNGPPGTVVAVTGTACGTAAAPATSVTLFLTGPAITTPAPGQAFPGTLVPGSTSGDFTGSVTIPASARTGESYTVTARCANAAGTGTVGTAGPAFQVIDTGLTGAVTGAVTTATAGVTGTGLTSTSGATTATTGATTGTTTGTTGVATPITQTPTFTG